MDPTELVWSLAAEVGKKDERVVESTVMGGRWAQRETSRRGSLQSD